MWDKISRIINIKGRKVYVSASSFRGLGPWLLGPVAFNLGQQNASWWEHEAADTCSPHGIQETKGER